MQMQGIAENLKGIRKQLNPSTILIAVFAYHNQPGICAQFTFYLL